MKFTAVLFLALLAVASAAYLETNMLRDVAETSAEMASLFEADPKVLDAVVQKLNLDRSLEAKLDAAEQKLDKVQDQKWAIEVKSRKALIAAIKEALNGVLAVLESDDADMNLAKAQQKLAGGAGEIAGAFKAWAQADSLAINAEREHDQIEDQDDILDDQIEGEEEQVHH